MFLPCLSCFPCLSPSSSFKVSKLKSPAGLTEGNSNKLGKGALGFSDSKEKKQKSVMNATLPIVFPKYSHTKRATSNIPSSCFPIKYYTVNYCIHLLFECLKNEQKCKFNY